MKPHEKQARKRLRKKRKMVKQSPIVAYCRVSTDKQGKSGLGLEAQQEAIGSYAGGEQGGKVLATYVEIESGKRSDRPELAKALAHAKRSGAKLVVAKLDRLSRNVAFLSKLMESKVDFVCCDYPTANKLTIHILVSVAEHEAEMISARTVAALNAYKARGGKLGANLPQCNRLTNAARKRGAKNAAEVHKAKADGAYADLIPQVQEWRNGGLTLVAIASRLNDAGHTTRRGKTWNHVQVKRVLERA
jgi:DNA invertase Pin-like site-specific DNA recombinase